MNSNSNILGKYNTKRESISSEILNWYYENNDDCIIVIWNDHNQIIHISQNVENWFDLYVSELIGKQWTNFVSYQQAKEINEHFRRTDDRLEIPQILFTSYDKEYTFQVIIDQITFNSEKCYICKLKDTTYINELKNVLLDSEKLVLAGQLSAGLIHEIRNPLTSLKGFLQLVQAGIEQKEKYFHVMINEVEKLEKITSELLHLAKPFEDIQQIEIIDDLIHDVLFIMSTQTELRDIYFITELEENLTVKCNATQIKQVLINIIKNGVEAMDKTGIIKVKTRKEDNYVAIDILDEGQGISEEIVKEIGKPFISTKEDGTGLGLMITTHIIEAHNGKLQISANEEVGTNFTILLPLAKS